MTILFRPQGAFGWFSYTTSRDTIAGSRSSVMITNANGLRMSYPMLRNRWDGARDRAATLAQASGDSAMASKIREFRFMDIRPKAASEIEDLATPAACWVTQKRR